MQLQLRSIFSLILQFKNLQEQLFSAAQFQVDSDRKLEQEVEKRSKQVNAINGQIGWHRIDFVHVLIYLLNYGRVNGE